LPLLHEFATSPYAALLSYEIAPVTTDPGAVCGANLFAKRVAKMPTITNANLLWGLVTALALVIGLIAGRLGFAGQGPLPPDNFRADFPLKQIQGKTFKDETVQVDGNAFTDCTFDNVVFKFDGKAPFTFTNDHFESHSKYAVTSDSPAIKAVIVLMSAFIKAENPNQNRIQENK
jgi:hypothetical protein